MPFSDAKAERRRKMAEILTIDHPRFEKFLNKLLKKMNSTSRILRTSFFYKDREGNLYLGFDEEREHEEMIREVLQGMNGIDTEGTLQWFKNLEDFCDCEDCQWVLSVIRPRKTAGTDGPKN
jgi:hypothetical protein